MSNQIKVLTRQNLESGPKPSLLLVSSSSVTSQATGIAVRVKAFADYLSKHYSISIVAPVSDLGLLEDEQLPWERRIAFTAKKQVDRFSEANHQDLQQALLQASEIVKPSTILVWNTDPSLVKKYFSGSSIILDLIDSPTRFRLSQIRTCKGLKEFFRELKNLPYNIRQERNWCKAATLSILVTNEDLLMTSRIAYPAKIALLPQGVLSKEHSTETRKSQLPTMVFTGNLAFPPNIQAIHYFVTHVLARISSAIPEVEFWIAGCNPDPSIRAYKSCRSIKLFEDPQDIASIASASWIAVAPMRSGSGVKIKILEAWALGIPVVFTSRAKSGLAKFPLFSVCLADSAAEFAEKTLRLLRDENLRRTIGQQAKSAVKESHCWDTIGSRLLKMIKDLES